MNRPRSRLVTALIAMLLAATLVACGDDDGDSTEAPPADAGETDGGEVIEVELVDFEFKGLPDRVSVGTRLTVVNNSQGEVHEIVVLRLRDDEERSVEELLALPEDEADALFDGPPAMVLLAAPGGPQIDAVGDGTLTEPGRYVVICAIPTGVDPDVFFAAVEEGGDGPPEIEGAGPPHFIHGMVGELIVE